mmetsp:Transcript_28701/g.63147  ORF Transcript_28701/g.63147 Transcript_28701/m.63147 type:complete len:224 (+) Transcript_28701:630-1301(+)
MDPYPRPISSLFRRRSRRPDPCPEAQAAAASASALASVVPYRLLVLVVAVPRRLHFRTRPRHPEDRPPPRLGLCSSAGRPMGRRTLRRTTGRLRRRRRCRGPILLVLPLPPRPSASSTRPNSAKATPRPAIASTVRAATLLTARASCVRSRFQTCRRPGWSMPRITELGHASPLFPLVAAPLGSGASSFTIHASPARLTFGSGTRRGWTTTTIPFRMLSRTWW